jgi:hypothetical protein
MIEAFQDSSAPRAHSDYSTLNATTSAIHLTRPVSAGITSLAAPRVRHCAFSGQDARERRDVPKLYRAANQEILHFLFENSSGWTGEQGRDPRVPRFGRGATSVSRGTRNRHGPLSRGDPLRGRRVRS